MSYETADSQKEEFRKYLESLGQEPTRGGGVGGFKGEPFLRGIICFTPVGGLKPP